jgi:hypothetical protein
MGTAIRCQAHDQPVHSGIANAAAASSEGLLSFLGDNVGQQYAPYTISPKIQFDNPDKEGAQSPLNWIRQGAVHEDDTPRFGDHFYTLTPTRLPGQVRGLTDWSESLILPAGTSNSFAWGTVPGLPKPSLAGVPPASITNTENWPCARSYELGALTKTNSTDRSANLAHMLYALGHVLHLNQDLSQPDHVRNDEHFLAARRWIEKFGSKNYRYEVNAFPLEPRGWSNWQSHGFSKLLDFWDRGKFSNGGSTGLDADARGDSEAKLGLAEFSNGNFLGEDATYAEFFGANDWHYFPFPSLKNTTQPQINPHNLLGTVSRTITLSNGKQGNRLYIDKTGAGIIVSNHSALHYFAVKHSPKMSSPEMGVGLTINDPNVLQEYHSILIPKAIEYSAGILDYFFRGKLDVAVGPGSTAETVGLQITNKSGSKLLGGAFKLYWDNASSNRTELPDSEFTTTYSGSLDDGATTTAEFTNHTGAVQYILVYQGTIGASNSTPHDPVDANIAIAAARVCCVPDAGPPVPNPLSQPDDTVFGPVSVSDTNPVSFGNLPPGSYQLEYLDGVLDVWIRFGDPEQQEHYSYITFYENSPFPGEPSAGVKSSFSPFFLAGFGTDALGIYSTIGEVEDATLDLNPLPGGGWDGGEVFMFGEIYNSTTLYFSGSTSARYHARRILQPYPEPDQIRIKDWGTTVEPQINICNTCANSSGAEWDGTFPEQDGSWDLPHWINSAAAAIRGKAIGSYPEIGYAFDRWTLTFYCGDGEVVWSGRKNVGTDPTGTYIQDLDGAPDQCASSLKCVVVESY